MDFRAWERRTGALDSLAYANEYGYGEHGYYEEDAGDVVSQAEYEEFLFQCVLDKIRRARSTGESDVQLTPEELEAYRTRLLGPSAPAARAPPAAHPVSAPVPMPTPQVPMPVPGHAAIPSTTNSASGSNSVRSSKGKQRNSFFASRSKKEKTGTRKRTPSNASQTVAQTRPGFAVPPPNEQPVTQPPGFVVPGPNGQVVYAPINAYHSYPSREVIAEPNVPLSRPDPRKPHISQQPMTPPRTTIQRITPPRTLPGSFPSASPQSSLFEATPPRPPRPSSSNHDASLPSTPEWQQGPELRSRSSSIQQPAKLVPFPVTEYQHYTAEPYQYQMPGQVTASSSSVQLSPQTQPIRRVPVPRPASANYVAMPRRVPVPVQQPTAPAASIQGSYSDPVLGLGIQNSRAEGAEADGAEDGGRVIDVVPNTAEKGYRVQTVRPTGGSGSGSGKANERKRKTSRRKS